MSINKIVSVPICEMTELNNLFIELTEKNCNQRCKHCYIDFSMNRNVKDFISIDKIKKMLEDTEKENVHCFYLTGAEPMTHPDFNSILRLCLKKNTVAICTNGSFINEKKARFLKKVEDESENRIVFMLPLWHFNELKNDDLRWRGSFRQILHATKNLVKYDFKVIFVVTNYYKESKKELINGFKNVFDNIDVAVEDWNFQINEFYDETSKSEITESTGSLDCQTGRILTQKGVYVCPFLANDHRGRMGADFTDYGKKVYLETQFCVTCAKNKEKMFSLNNKLFT